MPIAVTCPACAAKLKAPDQAAGKAVRCPNCRGPIAVPEPADYGGFEVVEDAPPTPTRARRASPEADDRPPALRPERDDDRRPPRRRPARGEDDRDDEGYRPRRRKPKRSRLPLIVGGVFVLGVALAGAAGLAYWLLAGRDDAKVGPIPRPNAPADPTPPAAKAGPGVPLPPGWEKFNDPLDEIDLYFPGGQPEKNDSASQKLTRQSGAAGDIWAKTVGGKTYTLSRSTASAAEVRAGKPEALLFEAMKGFAGAIPGISPGKFAPPVWDDKGRVSRVVAYDIPRAGKRVILRGLVVGNRLVMAIVVGEATMGEKDADVRPFLENLRPAK